MHSPFVPFGDFTTVLKIDQSRSAYRSTFIKNRRVMRGDHFSVIDSTGEKNKGEPAMLLSSVGTILGGHRQRALWPSRRLPR